MPSLGCFVDDRGQGKLSVRTRQCQRQQATGRASDGQLPSLLSLLILLIWSKQGYRA